MTDLKNRYYEILVPYLERIMAGDPELTCHQIDQETGIPPATVVTLMSIYLNGRREQAKMQQERCPTCGKLKDEVTDPALCRDMIHFL
jgi:hypothetical protein